MAVTGATTLTGGLQASGGVEVDDLVASSFDLNGNADISGTTLMTGKLTANGGIDTKAISATTLTTSGNANIGGALTVASNLTANNIVSKSGYIGVQTASKSYYPIAVVDYDANGGFCGYRGFSGMTAIGSGESVAQLQTNVETDYGMNFGSENLFLTSDQGIWLLTNANSWDSRRTYNLVQNGLYSRLTGVTKGGNITGDNVKFFQIFLCDEASNATSSRLGGFEINTRNGSQVMLMAYKPVAGDTAYESIWIQYGTDGVVTTHSPTPPTDDSSTQIATTAWATNNGFLGYKKLSSIQSVKGCFYFDNGSGIDLAEAGLDDYVGSADWYGVQYSTSTGNDKSQYVFNAGNIWRRYSDSTLGSEIWSDWIQICQANGLIAMTSQTPSAGDNSTRIATTEWVLSQLSTSIPTGAIMFFAQNAVPSGWLLCNGANVSRTTYANLFAVIGTRHGAGNGSTTFTLPNLNDRFAEGTTTTNNVGQVVQAGLPNITGAITGYDMFRSMQGAGPFFDDTTTNAFGLSRPSGGHSHNASSAQIAGFDASRATSLYGASSTVQPPAIRLLPCIKV